MSKHLVLLVILACAPILGCSDSNSSQTVRPNPAGAPGTPGTPPPPPPPSVPPEDVSGAWYSRTVNNAVNCGIGEFIDAQALVITQTGSDITLLTSTGTSFAGTVNGDIVEWTGSFDERGGTTTITTLSITVSGDSASGNADWTWTDGVDSCNGTMAITASRDWSTVETLSNSFPRLADQLTITDGVAFVTGEAVTATDVDYFAFKLTADATVQVELSHFDPATNNLDLELLDENENQVVLSDGTDGFEKIEADVLAGETFFIGVLPISVPGEAPYIVSVDVN